LLYLLPLSVLSAIWLSVFLAYRIPGIIVSDEMIQEGRELPQDSVLEELKDFDFLEGRWKSKQELVDAASRLLGGDLRVENCSVHLTMPFSARDLDHLPPACDFLIAAFVVPHVLVQAYEATGQEKFLIAAQDYIAAAQDYEQSALLPPGDFWNDHAVAERVCVLTNFWRLYRHSPGYRPEVARQVFQMVGRSEQLLAKPGQFTFATNHGIMQNLALLHASLAFPALPRGREYQRLARARLADQMKFYVSGEGVVMEHSAGYHVFGMELIAMALRYLDLMHEPVPPDWIEKYQRAEKFYAALRRPDGSLPMFGDTFDGTDPLGPLVTVFDQDHGPRRLFYQQEWKPPEATYVYPVSGYAIWWDGLEFWPNPQNLSQTVIAWSNFPSQAHKHADEMSVLFWAGGQTWLSNVGYWPYENKWRNTIESWAGSDAPHLVGENPSAFRATRLVSSGASANLTALELERTGSENYIVRRQVVHCKPDLWLVLDNSFGSEKDRTTTTWTSGSGVRWQQQSAGGFRLESPNVNDRLDIFFLGSPDTEQRLLRGSSRPFAGWQLEHRVPVPASALVVEQPAKNSWAATIWTWEKGRAAERVDGTPQMTHWIDATHWEMQLPGEASGIALRREGNMLRLQSGRGTDAALELMAPPDVGPAYAELRNQFMASASRYPHFTANPLKRKKVTYLLLGILLLQQIFFVVYKRIHAPRPYTLKCLTLIAWIVGGIWLVCFYF
jgi:hypothetical protein